MDSEVAFDFPPYVRIYKDGRVDRLFGTDTVPPSFDEATGIHSKDVTINPQSDVYYRLYLPKNTTSKLPLLVYYHGGGFVLETAASPRYQNHLNALASEANIIVVSVNYRRAPEDPVPAAYEDSWEALKWVGSHSSGSGPEEWLNSHADLSRVYCSGDSAGANIAHYVALRFGLEKFPGISLLGIVLVHPFFWGTEAVGSEPTDPEKRARIDSFFKLAYPTCSPGLDDPAINPGMDPNLSKLGTSRVLVCVAEKDDLNSRGWYYKESLTKSGWSGSMEVMEAKGEDHVFHLSDPTCENARALMKRLVEFFNR